MIIIVYNIFNKKHKLLKFLKFIRNLFQKVIHLFQLKILCSETIGGGKNLLELMLNVAWSL